MYHCGELPVVLEFLSGAQSSYPECRSADWARSVAVASGAAVLDRQPAEGRHSAWPPCCEQTQELDRCDSYQPDRSDMTPPAIDRQVCESVVVSFTNLSWGEIWWTIALEFSRICITHVHVRKAKLVALCVCSVNTDRLLHYKHYWMDIPVNSMIK